MKSRSQQHTDIEAVNCCIKDSIEYFPQDDKSFLWGYRDLHGWAEQPFWSHSSCRDQSWCVVVCSMKEYSCGHSMHSPRFGQKFCFSFFMMIEMMLCGLFLEWEGDATNEAKHILAAVMIFDRKNIAFSRSSLWKGAWTTFSDGSATDGLASLLIDMVFSFSWAALPIYYLCTNKWTSLCLPYIVLSSIAATDAFVICNMCCISTFFPHTPQLSGP